MNKKLSYNKVYNLLLIILLFFNFLLRVDEFRKPHYHYQGDYNRDYLIASHIVKYREIPLTGPGGEFGSAGSSPIYYYFLASLLLLGLNDIIFLGYINLLLQILTLIIIYFLAQSMFDKKTALISLLLFGFAQGIISQSGFVWQPYIMQPFTNLSYLLLFLSYKRRVFSLLLLSIVIFVLSLALYYPMLAITPMFLFLAVLILVYQKKSYKYYIGAGLTLITSLFILYIPFIIYLLTHPNSDSAQFINKLMSIFTLSLKEILKNFLTRTDLFLNSFFINPEGLFVSFAYLVAPAFLLITAYYFLALRINVQRKYYSAIILFSILLFLIIAAFSKVSQLITFPVRHFTPIFGLFVIFIAEIINLVFSGKIILSIFKILIIVILIFEFQGLNLNSANSLFNRSNLILFSFLKNPISFLNIPYIENPQVKIIKNEILRIQSEKQRRNLDFFQFISYRNGSEDRFVNEIFWTPLERELNRKLITVNDDFYQDYKPIPSNEYFFLRCQFEVDENTQCLEAFSREHSNYLLLRKIYTQYPFTIYLTKKD